MKAVVLAHPGAPLTVSTVPFPAPGPGSVTVKVLATAASAGYAQILSGNHPFKYPNGMIPGRQAIGRVFATGPDTTSLKEGQLVLLEPHIVGRDDPHSSRILWGMWEGVTDGSRTLMHDERNWKHATLAEYVRAPLENVHPLDEERLLGKLGYGLGNLLALAHQLVAFGGFRAIDLKPGERVIVAPATGQFSFAAVQVAVALGADVIAVCRAASKAKLERLAARFPPGRVQVVGTTGDVEADAAAMRSFGKVDAYLDVSPAFAAGSTHVRSAFLALAHNGRAVLMGVLQDDVAVPYEHAMMYNLTIKGRCMYEREDVRLLIRMAESGVLKLGEDGVVDLVETDAEGRPFGLENIEDALKVADAQPDGAKIVVVTVGN